MPAYQTRLTLEIKTVVEVSINKNALKSRSILESKMNTDRLRAQEKGQLGQTTPNWVAAVLKRSE